LLCAADDEGWQAKRNSLADKLTVEAKALADLKIEKATVEGERRTVVDTLILAGINTTSCVLCCGFEATNRDYRVVIARDAVDSMDGEEMHCFALRLMAATVGWVLTNDEIIVALG
jgi:nicotinamidase-related amidase